MQARNEESLEESSTVISDEACKMVAGEGVGPSIQGQEPRVIPFHHPAINYISSYIDTLIYCQP